MEISIVHRRCDNCRFFDDSITDEDGMRSPCRALPPTIPIGARSPAGEWPFVEDSDWCGHHMIDQDKCDANAAAEIAEEAPPHKGLPTGSFFIDNEPKPCAHCNRHHIPGTPCVDPLKATRKPGDPQTLTHGIQAVKRWAKGQGNG